VVVRWGARSAANGTPSLYDKYHGKTVISQVSR
jgi:hypothetical protein